MNAALISPHSLLSDVRRMLPSHKEGRDYIDPSLRMELLKYGELTQVRALDGGGRWYVGYASWHRPGHQTTGGMWSVVGSIGGVTWT